MIVRDVVGIISHRVQIVPPFSAEQNILRETLSILPHNRTEAEEYLRLSVSSVESDIDWYMINDNMVTASCTATRWYYKQLQELMNKQR